MEFGYLEVARSTKRPPPAPKQLLCETRFGTTTQPPFSPFFTSKLDRYSPSALLEANKPWVVLGEYSRTNHRCY